jgi:hypothetical protein
MQFENLPLQPGREYACSAAAELSGRRPVAWIPARQQKFPAYLVVWTMQSCNGRQAVMSALEALVLAGKGLNAFSVLFLKTLLGFFSLYSRSFFKIPQGCFLLSLFRNWGLKKSIH